MGNSRVTDLVARLQTGEVSRREFMRYGAAAGLSATALSSILANPAYAAPGSGRATLSRNQIDASTLVIADSLSGGDWLTLDPAWYYEINPTAAMYVIYECLYHVPDGANPTDIAPMLADGMPEFSDDFLTATVKLKQGITFANSGNEMTAADVIFSFGRLAATQFQPSFLATDYWVEIGAVDDYTL